MIDDTLNYPTVITSRRADPNPISAAVVKFTVTFSESVTGVEASDFVLVTTGVRGATITNISGSGSTYTVAVNTGTGDGTIRLDVVDNDSIKDGNNNPLGGMGTSNGNYISGEVYIITTGADTAGVFRPSNGLLYLKNQNTTGFVDVSINYGLGGDYPVTGDWDGDGVDTTGVFRPSNGIIFLKNTNTTGFADVALNYGIPGDKPVTGDWDDDGIDTIGVYRNGTFYLRNSNTVGFADIIFGLGNPGDMPIAGNWDGQP